MKEQKDTVCNAIYEWTDRDVWDFIKERDMEVNPLYAMGFRRVGCVGCPFATRAEKQKEFAMFPTYKRAFIHAFQKIVDREDFDKARGNWVSGESMFDWWIQANENNIEGQMSLWEK